MSKFIGGIDWIIRKVGQGVSQLNLFLVALICVDVLLRYLFKITKIWVIEFELYLYAFIVLFGLAYALQYDKHVRVDLFYSKKSDRTKAFIDLVGGVLYLLPWCCIMIWVTFGYAHSSLKINETSSQPGGLPYLFIMKFGIFAAFVLLFLQGISTIYKSLLVLIGNKKYEQVRPIEV